MFRPWALVAALLVLKDVKDKKKPD